MVVFWSVVLVCCVDERVYFCANSEDVEVCHVEDVEFLREREREREERERERRERERERDDDDDDLYLLREWWSRNRESHKKCSVETYT